MRIVKREVTKEEIAYVESEDGMRFYLRGAADSAEALEEAKKRAREYEESALGVARALAMGVPHKMFSADSYEAAQIIPDSSCCCEDAVYVFKIRTNDDLKNVLNWFSLNVGFGNMSSCIIKEIAVTPEGKNYIKYQSMEEIDAEKYVGKEAVFRLSCDSDWANFWGSFEDIKQLRDYAQAKLDAALKELNDSVKEDK